MMSKKSRKKTNKTNKQQKLSAITISVPAEQLTEDSVAEDDNLVTYIHEPDYAFQAKYSDGLKLTVVETFRTQSEPNSHIMKISIFSGKIVLLGRQIFHIHSSLDGECSTTDKEINEAYAVLVDKYEDQLEQTIDELRNLRLVVALSEA